MSHYGRIPGTMRAGFVQPAVFCVPIGLEGVSRGAQACVDGLQMDGGEACGNLSVQHSIWVITVLVCHYTVDHIVLRMSPLLCCGSYCVEDVVVLWITLC